MGQRVIAIDPKNDFNKLYNVNPNIEIIDINDIRPNFTITNANETIFKEGRERWNSKKY